MKIAVINESFLQEDHYAKLRELGEVAIAIGNHSEDEAIDLIKDADIVIGDMFETNFSNKVLDSAKNLKLLALNTIGYDLVDVEYARQLGINVANSKSFGVESVAEHAAALAFALARHIPRGIDAMREKPFQVDPANPEMDSWRGMELRGKTFGVIGYGEIGRRTAEIMHAIGMEVLVYANRPINSSFAKKVELDELLKQSDIVSLHVSLNKSTRSMMGEGQLKLMKPTAYLINTARGEVIDEPALVAALKQGTLAGAGLDFLGEWSADNELLKMDNVIPSPHVGWYSDVSAGNIANVCTENVISFINGSPQNIVN